MDIGRLYTKRPGRNFSTATRRVPHCFLPIDMSGVRSEYETENEGNKDAAYAAKERGISDGLKQTERRQCLRKKHERPDNYPKRDSRTHDDH